MARKSSPISNAASGNSKGGAGCMIAFGFIFFVAGASFLYFMFITAALKIQAAKSWTETPCVIKSSKVASHSSSDGTTYSVEIVYTYTFNGADYESDQYKFFGASSSGKKGKQAVVRKFPKGKEATCYVNPDNPSEAVINRDYTKDMLFALLPCVFILVGGGIMYAGIHSMRSDRRKKVERESGISTLTAPGEASSLPEFDASGSPAEVKPESSPAMRACGCLFMALFWNGIVSVFLSETISDWKRGRTDWFSILFLTPFVIIGIAFILGVLYQLLSAFNPRPRIKLNSKSVATGGVLRLQWMLDGRANRISQLKLNLVGEESATYRVGTSSRTETKEIANIPIADTTHPEQIKSGRAEIQIPADAMHSFERHSNKITWKIQLHGDIKYWPDIKEDFSIVIVPAKTQLGKPS